MKNIIFLTSLLVLLTFCKKKDNLQKQQTTIEVNFDSQVNSVVEGDSVKFTNLSKSSDSKVTYQWTFIGGTPSKSSQKNPVIKYSSFGDYDVKLVVISNLKKDSLTNHSFIKVKNLIGKDTVSAKFETQNSSIFEDESVVFSNLSQSSNTDLVYNWTFSGGTPSKSSEKNPVIKYNKYGSYNVKLVVSSKSQTDSIARKGFVQVKSSLTKGLVLFYPLNGNALDYSGNNINGTISFSTLPTTGKNGVDNTAYKFNGNSSSFIQIPTNKLKLDNFSYSMWVYLEELPAYGNQYMPFSIGSVGGDQHFQAMNNVHDGHGWAFGGYSQNAPAFFNSSRISLEAKKWYLLLVTRSNTKLNLYVDCNLVAEYSSTETRLPFYGLNEAIAKLGTRFDGAYPLKGKIDEFRIYNRVLTASDIARFCDSGPTLPEILK